MICGTRGSPLALAQTNIVVGMLDAAAEVRVIKTSGDLYRGQFGTDGATRGLFTKEIDIALEDCEIDIAVHSLKDVRLDFPFHMAIPQRGPAADVMVTRHPSFHAIPEGGRIGTGSPRRVTELRHMRPDLEPVPIRGNIGTRLEKVEELDGVVMAEAGLQRLALWGHNGYTFVRFPRELFIPAACQGTLAVACRKDDAEARKVVDTLRDEASTACAMAEREVMHAIGGNCHIPAGAWASVVGGDRMRIFAVINDPRNNRSYRDLAVGPLASGRAVARTLAASLLSKGADDVVGRFS
ncbi:hydroxymethylbilane synthase [archaeon]|nr:MAG: hydroxymethylbilane synthase [archaeon]